MAGADGEKTEQATPRRLQKAREDGKAPVSREFTLLAGLSAGLLALAAQMAAAPDGVPLRFAVMLHESGADTGRALRQAALTTLYATGPCAIAAALGAAAASLVQTGFLINLSALRPDPGRISPLRGLKRLGGGENWVQAGKAMAKLAVLGLVLLLAFRRLAPSLGDAAFRAPATLQATLIHESMRLVLPLLAWQVAIATADVLWVRFQHARQLRMTIQEVREEHKDSEGNPQVKQRLRQITRTRARRRMMAAVPRATVIITNPTHYAVALAYERGSRGAPRLVAKGVDDIAARIRDIARESRVPIVANPPVARALYRIEIDTEIPAEHFKAVAEIVAYVWRINGRQTR